MKTLVQRCPNSSEGVFPCCFFFVWVCLHLAWELSPCHSSCSLPANGWEHRQPSRKQAAVTQGCASAAAGTTSLLAGQGAFPAAHAMASPGSHSFQPWLWQRMLLCLILAVMGWVSHRRSGGFQSPWGLLSPKGIITHWDGWNLTGTWRFITVIPWQYLSPLRQDK